MVMEPLSSSYEPGKRITKKQWITVIVLCFVNLINYMDRFTLAGILDKVQCEFNIENNMVGFLQTVFVISYMIFAPLFGYLGDRYSRRAIMAGGVFLWGLTTLLGSFMNHFGWFIAFRAMVGIGEASYSTIAPTIISDLFIDDRRSIMLALFYFAIPVGSGLGYIVGSETAKLANDWRWALRVTPVLGLVAVVLIIFVMIDPPRGESEGSTLKPTAWSEDIKYLGKNRSFILSTLGFTCVAFVAGALAWWGPKFIFLGLRSQEGSVAKMEDVALKFGLITMVSGLIGVPLGSILAQKLRPWNARADPLICAFGLLASTPLLFLASIMAQYSDIACFTLIFFGELFLNLNWSIVADVLLYVVIPTRRSTAEAVQILISHALGDAGSPYLIGQVSDWIHKGLVDDSSLKNNTISDGVACNSSDASFLPEGEEATLAFRSLQYSLFITSFVEVLGGLFFLMTAWYIVSDKAKADKTINGDELMNDGSSQPTHYEADDNSDSPPALNHN